MVDSTATPSQLTSAPQQAPPPDWVANPEHRENQTLLKVESKEFLNQWVKSQNPSATADARLTHLLKFLYLARQKKMISFGESSIQLQKVHADFLLTLKGPKLEITYSDLTQLIKSPDTQLVLDAFQLIEASNWTEPIHAFEYEFATKFIKDCIVTTFPDYRQKFMKSLHHFFIRLRTINYKDIKKNKPVEPLVAFLTNVIDHCQHNLYLDKPIEGSFPLFDVLKIIQELFGGIEYHLNKSRIFEPLNFLQRVGLLESRSLFNFLVNSLKSSWANVRRTAFELLARYADSYQAFQDPKFVNQLLIPTALDYANDPRAMMAEAAALMLKLAFLKCTDVLVLNNKPVQGSKNHCRLQLLWHILQIVTERLQTFKTTLISQGKTTALIHGHIAFFKHIFYDFQLDLKSLSQDEYAEWRKFFNHMLQTTLEISKVCSSLLSNNRLSEEGHDLVDSRGHPIVQDNDVKNIKEQQGETKFEDYENLILVGIWLAVKENGETIQNLLKWAHLPVDAQDTTSFLHKDGVESLCDNFLEMLFQFKHRGAIEITADTFEIFMSRLLVVPQFAYLPKKMLDRTLERISKESHSTVLRRSAGIPPTIIAILRAEPGIIKANRSWNKKKGVEKRTEETVLLNTTLSFLLKLAKEAALDDSKIHALNIMKFIFQDTYLREDITQFITPAMILSCDEFKNENWNIRNSALMCFTALIKRLLGTHHIQDQDLARRKGLSAIDLHKDFTQLIHYFSSKLGAQAQKVEKDKQDMVNFSIMLLLSRLVPFSFHSVQTSKQAHINDDFIEQIKLILDLIRQQAGNSTYFVRKIAAQALLPLLEFNQWLPEVYKCLQQITESKLRQNQAHGLLLRVNVFLSAYFQYRHIAVSEQEHARFGQEETEIKDQLFKFLKRMQTGVHSKYSKVTWGLFVQTLWHIIVSGNKLEAKDLDILNTQIGNIISQVYKDADLLNGKELSLENQSYLEELLVIRIEILFQLGQDEQLVTFIKETIKQFMTSNIDLTYVFMKAFVKKIKVIKDKKSLQILAEFTLESVVGAILKQEPNGGPNFMAKILEMGLKVLYKAWKHLLDHQWENQKQFRDNLVDQLSLVQEMYPHNDIFKAQVIKLQVLVVRFLERDQDAFIQLETQMSEVAETILQNCAMNKKEQVRIVSAQSFATLIPILSERNLRKNLFFKSASLYSSYLVLMNALVFILTDENPQIRLFIQNQGIRLMLANEVTLNTVQCEMSDANDTVLLQQVFQRITDQFIEFQEQKQNLNQDQISFSDLKEKQMEGQLPDHVAGQDYHLTNEQVQFLYYQDFLSKFLEENPYREHLELNFDDKIFFHEPDNKFFDLPGVRVLAWEQLMRIRHMKNAFARPQKKQIKFENEVIGELLRCYSTKNELRRTSTEFEALMSRVIECVSGEHCTQVFKDTVLENNRIEHIIKHLVAFKQ